MSLIRLQSLSAAKKNKTLFVQNKKERLQKILSANGIASRREAEKMIHAGRIKINGVTATLGQSAQLGIDLIMIDGTMLKAVEKCVYLMLNKPCGYLTTVKDQKGRQTVMELVSDVGERIFPIGRLDLKTEGLLLFTNDGEFANRVMHPSYNMHKTYDVKAVGDIKKASELLRAPLEIDGFTVRAISVKATVESVNGGSLQITIAEGRNRQVRKMCNLCGLKVISLKRVSIGKLMLGGLKSGQWRYLTDNEVLSFGKGHTPCN